MPDKYTQKSVSFKPSLPYTKATPNQSGDLFNRFAQNEFLKENSSQLFSGIEESVNLRHLNQDSKQGSPTFKKALHLDTFKAQPGELNQDSGAYSKRFLSASQGRPAGAYFTRSHFNAAAKAGPAGDGRPTTGQGVFTVKQVDFRDRLRPTTCKYKRK